MYELAIMDGNLVCPETGTEFHANLYLANGRIEKIGPNVLPAKKSICAEGLTVSPGFIDIHMHREDELAPEFGFSHTNEAAWLMARQGVTTATGGNCGLGYVDFNDYMAKIEKLGTPINYMAYTGYSRIRESLGVTDHNACAGKEVVRKAVGKIREALNAGAVGLSIGLEYTPGASFEEMCRVVAPLKDYHGALTSVHFRHDGDRALESIDEMISLARNTGVPVNIAHVNSCAAFGSMKETLVRVREAIEAETDICMDAYPYNAFCTRLGSAVFEDGCLDRWRKGYDSLLISDGPFAGRTFDEPLFRKLRKEAPETLVTAFVMEEKECLMALTAQDTIIASDGVTVNGMGHPRGAGTFPRALGRYCRDQGIFSFAEAVRKMTILPAKRLGLDRKGRLEEGADADIVIFDKDKIIDNATYEQPCLAPQGVNYLIVDARLVLENNQIIEKNAGRVIRKAYH